MKKHLITAWACLGFCLLAGAVLAQRIIIPEPPFPQPPAGLFELNLQSLRVDVEVKDRLAKTTLLTEFKNPTTHQLQGYFYYPIAKGMTIDDFQMEINGQMMKGEILTAEKAKKIYEDIVRRAQDPALLEYYNKDLLKVRIFPIQPGKIQKVSLTYLSLLPIENGTVALDLPLGQGKQIAESVFVQINLESKEPIRNLFCPTHAVNIQRNGDHEATMTYESNGKPKNPFFKAYYTPEEGDLGASLLTFQESPKEDGFFHLTLSPGEANEQPIAAKDVTFVFDASGSMVGEKLEQAKEALRFCMEHLNPNDRFNLIRFSTEAEALFQDLEELDRQSKAEALEYIDGLEAIGGTNIDEALSLALKQTNDPDRPSFIIFLTDGKPTIGEIDDQRLLKKLQGQFNGNTRIFSFGVGTKLNTVLLDALADQTKASRMYVLPEEDIEVKVSNFYEKIAYPVLTDLEISWTGDLNVRQQYPKVLPSLFKGETLSIMGQYQGTGSADLLVKGKVNGKTVAFEYTFEVKPSTDHAFIPPIWAARAVGYLLDQIRLNGQSEELVNEVVRLSKQYGIITPYTSYLILEDEAQQLSMNEMLEEEAIFSRRNQSTISAAPAVDAKTLAGGMYQKEGRASVEASEEIQTMNYSENLADINVGQERMNYRDEEGTIRNMGQDVQMVQGRAQYLNGSEWMDSALLNPVNSSLPTNRVVFNSPAYFKLLEDAPESADFLALGRNIRFVLHGQIWEIYEEG